MVQFDCWVAYEMSVAPKSTVWLQKEFMPRTEFETVKLMLPPSSSLN